MVWILNLENGGWTFSKSSKQIEPIDIGYLNLAVL